LGFFDLQGSVERLRRLTLLAIFRNPAKTEKDSEKKEAKGTKLLNVKSGDRADTGSCAGKPPPSGVAPYFNNASMLYRNYLDEQINVQGLLLFQACCVHA
jgi:hypothetical protein